MSDVKLTLNNAQGGGPQLVLTKDGIIKQKVWLRDLRSPDKGIYFSVGPTSRRALEDYPAKDGIVLFPS
jgi:hypothetical protein